jgi:hypothetical protein
MGQLAMKQFFIRPNRQQQQQQQQQQNILFLHFENHKGLYLFICRPPPTSACSVGVG